MEAEEQFLTEMLEVYRQALKLGYNAGRFQTMLKRHGSFGTARRLLNSPTVSKGFVRLQELGALKWTVEAVALKPEWRRFFSAAQLDTAFKRLKAFGYDVPELERVSSLAPMLVGIVQQLNDLAKNHLIGDLQEIRRILHHRAHRSSHNLFATKPLNPHWTFHHGGRTELQYNVGFEDRGREVEFRHGVAFSLEPSRSAPDIVNILLPKIARFNDFMRIAGSNYADMRMWDWQIGQVGGDRLPGPIAPEGVSEGNFLMLGRHYSIGKIDVHAILADFDNLLPLYRFVEGEESGLSRPVPTVPSKRERRSARKSWTIANIQERTLDINLRHNVLQASLYEQLASVHGSEAVDDEVECATGRIDLVVDQFGERWYYEIKTSSTAQGCVREGLSQLLEYAYWPSTQRPTRLTIVGEAALDTSTATYLEYLRVSFQLPIYYMQLSPMLDA